MTVAANDEVCSICGGSEDEHGSLHHEFNLNNQLIPRSREVKRPKVERIPTVVGAIDLELRHILLEKGIITNEDFAALRNPGAGAAGDREAGEAPGSS